MKNGIIIKAFVAIILITMTAFGAACSKGGESAADPTGKEVDSLQSVSKSKIPEITFPDSPVQGSNTNADTSITLNGDSINVEGRGAEAAGSTVIITTAGTYLITGTLNDGQIVVNTHDEEKVKLILNGVKAACSDSSPFYIISAPKKVIIYLQEGSVNVLEDGSIYDDSKADPDTDAPTSAIFSMEGLKFDGNGDLYVTGNYNKGIYTKDDLEIEGGSIYVKAVDDGIRGKDSITMTGGLVYIDAEADGFRTSNETDEGNGTIQIDNGTLYIKAGLDAIQSAADFSIKAGDIRVCCGGGSENSSSKANTSSGEGRGLGGRNSKSTTSSADETASAKGIKAEGLISISGGSLTIDSSDDAIHSNSDVGITGGSIYISSGDDGIHGDGSLTISGGIIEIVKSYEGLEALNVTISGGTNRVTATDDGINAAGGADLSSTNGRPGQNSFVSSDSGMITITGGYILVNAAGDGVDSNGNVEMSDGTLIVYGPTDNGNGAIDYNGRFNLTGGYLLAIGSSMAQPVTSDNQSVMSFTLKMDEDTLLHIQDSSRNEVLTVKAPKSYSSVIFSSSSLKSGETYTVYYGGSYSTEGTDGIYSGGEYSGGIKLGNLKI